MGILHVAHFTTRLPMVAYRSTCLRIASALQSRKVDGTLFLAIEFAKFLLALDPRRVILPRNNALAFRRGGRRPLGDPPPLPGPSGAADVLALGSCP